MYKTNTKLKSKFKSKSKYIKKKKTLLSSVV